MSAKLLLLVALAATIMTGCAQRPLPAIQPPPTPPQALETTVPISNKIVEPAPAHAHFDMHDPMPNADPE